MSHDKLIAYGAVAVLRSEKYAYKYRGGNFYRYNKQGYRIVDYLDTVGNHIDDHYEGEQCYNAAQAPKKLALFYARQIRSQKSNHCFSLPQG